MVHDEYLESGDQLALFVVGLTIFRVRVYENALIPDDTAVIPPYHHYATVEN